MLSLEWTRSRRLHRSCRRIRSPWGCESTLEEHRICAISGGLHLSTITGGNPNQTIIGAPDVYSGGGPGTGTYFADGAMVADNPFVQTIEMSHPASFTLALSALQATEVISSARLTWGTALDLSNQIDLVPNNNTPEPASALLVGLRRHHSQPSHARSKLLRPFRLISQTPVHKSFTAISFRIIKPTRNIPRIY